MSFWRFSLMRSLRPPSLSLNQNLARYMHQYHIGVQFLLTQRQSLPSPLVFVRLMIDL